MVKGPRGLGDTWRGRGNTYRQRSGGATLEAINALREQLEMVVFIYVPSHAGVVPNAYADGIAKAYLDRTHMVRLGRIVAQHVTSRSVIYEKRVGEHVQLKDGPTFKHARLGTMEWVRKRSKSAYRGREGEAWNHVSR